MEDSGVKKFPQRTYLIAIFMVALLAHFGFHTILPSQSAGTESSDFLSYFDPTAENFITGDGFTLGDGLAINIAPGYPGVLAILYQIADWLRLSKDFLLSLSNFLIIGLCSLLVFLIADSVISRSFSVAAALIFVTSPHILWLGKQPNSEIPFMLVFYLAVYWFWISIRTNKSSWQRYIVLGIFIGFASLIRPIGLGLFMVFPVLFIMLKPELHRTGVVKVMISILLGGLIILLPWEVLIYTHTGQVIPISTGGVPSIRDGLTFAVDSKDYREEVNVPNDVKTMMNETLMLKEAGELETFSQLSGYLMDQFRYKPLTMFKLYGIKVIRSWYGTDSGRYEGYIGIIQLTYLSLAFRGMWIAWKRGGYTKQLVIISGGLLLYFWIMTTMVLSIVRYLIPVIGIVLIFVPLGFTRNSQEEHVRVNLVGVSSP